MNNNSINKTDFNIELSHKHNILQLIESRLLNFQYLINSHKKNHIFFQTYLLNSQFYNENNIISNKKITRYYYFSLGIFNVLQSSINKGVKTLNNTKQLMEEFEYLVSSSTIQSMKYLIAQNLNHPYDIFNQVSQLNNDINGDIYNVNNNNSKKSLYKFNGNIIFEHLMTPPVTFQLSYPDVIVQCCESLIQLYQRFLLEDLTR